MIFEESHLAGAYLIKTRKFSDERGNFVKTYHADLFEEVGLAPDFRESYYSTSHRNVIRGMHFQVPPHDHDKLVYVIAGSVDDVLLDLRKSSPTYGQHVKYHLSGENHLALYIPSGIAHGFASREDNTVMVYNVTTVYIPESDRGVRWDSFGCDWNVKSPTVSTRDREFSPLDKFKSLFK